MVPCNGTFLVYLSLSCFVFAFYYSLWLYNDFTPLNTNISIMELSKQLLLFFKKLQEQKTWQLGKFSFSFKKCRRLFCHVTSTSTTFDFPASIYLLRVKNRNTRARCDIVVLVSLLLTLNLFHTLF